MAASVNITLLLLWLASAAIGFAGTAIFAHQARKFARMRLPPPNPPPAVAVLVPIKGAGAHAADCLASVLAQDYPAFRVIVAIEAEDDPAAHLARDVAARAGKPLAVLAAGAARQRGQKVHNLLAALATLSPRDEIVCFADADALWPRDALATLVRELAAWDTPVLVSGYRWMYPATSRAGAVLAAAANLPVAAIAKSPRWDLAWGGTMAAYRATLDRLDLASLWDRSLSDDVSLSRAVRAAGLDVKLMPNLVVPSPCDFTLGGALGFARRQYAMLRLYAPRHWLFSLAAYGIFFAGLGASIVAFVAPMPGYVQAIAGAAVTLAIARGAAHAAIAARLLPRDCSARLRGAFLLDTLFPFVPALLHAYGLAASLIVRRVRWAGIGYAMQRDRVANVEH